MVFQSENFDGEDQTHLTKLGRLSYGLVPMYKTENPLSKDYFKKYVNKCYSYVVQSVL